MFAYIIRRILATIPVMAVVALFVFSLLYLSPGDPAVILPPPQAAIRHNGRHGHWWDRAPSIGR